MEKDDVAEIPAHVVALGRAVEIAGGQAALADRMKQFFIDNPTIKGRTSISQQTVSYWLNNETLLDAIYWPAIEAATDRGVTRAELRPDVFPRGHAA